MKRSVNFHLKVENEHTILELSGLTPSEVIAKEYHYHRSCYKNITRKPKERTETDIQDSTARTTGFNSLTNFVRDHIIENDEILKLSQLTTL